jgi:TonB family protein
VLAALCASAPTRARAEITPPTPVHEVAGAWPAGVRLPHDVVVPVVVTVTKDGSVADAAVEVTTSPPFDEAALTAARAWRFTPARKDGHSVDARIRLAVRFPAAPTPPPPSPTPPPPSPPGALDVVIRGAPAPRSASEVTRDRAVLSAAPHRTADELLTVVPGVFITQHSGEGKAYQIFYRGFDAVHGQDLEIWAGGAPVNDVSNLHGQGYADLHFLPPETVRALHVTPGTYDPRQGDFAVAGTLRLELGYDQPGFTAKAQAGSFHTRRYFLAYRPETGPLSASDGTFAAAEFYETRGFGPARAAQRASAVAQVVFPLAPGADLRVLASTYSGHFASAGVLRLADIEAGKVDRFASYDSSQGGDSSRSQVVAELSHQDDDARLSLSTYLVLRGLRLRHDFTGFLTDPNGDSQQQLNDDLVLGMNAAYRRPLHVLSTRDHVEAGVTARTDWIEQSQRRLASVDNRVTAVEVDARVRAHDVGGYLDFGLHPHPRFDLSGGVRLDGLGYFTQDRGAKAAGQASSSQGLHIGKKVTADLHPFTGRLSGLHAVASYGEGFRSPQARSLTEGQTTPFTDVRSFEAGLRYGAPWAAASLAAFQTYLSDDLVFDQATARNERVPATRRTGVAADLRLTPRPWLDATASGTYTHAVFRGSDGEHAIGALVPYAPQLVVRGDLGLRPRLGQLRGRLIEGRFGTGLSWLARRPLPYGEWGHDVLLIDALAEVRVGGLALGIELYNLLDAGWYDGEFVYASRWDPGQGAALVPQRHVTVGAPRTVLGTLTVNF